MPPATGADDERAAERLAALRKWNRNARLNTAARSAVVCGQLTKDETVQFGMLGPLEVVYRGRRIDLGRPEQRVLLALLLIHANRLPRPADR